MSIYIFKYLTKAFEENGIIPIKIDQPLFNENCCIIPVELEQGSCYFKFFFASSLNQLTAEIEIVNHYRSLNIPVPVYINFNNKILLTSKQNSLESYFYATHNNGTTNNHPINDTLLINIIKFIAVLHNNILNYDFSSITISDNTDYQKLIHFYITNYSFFLSYKFHKSIEFFLEQGVDEVTMYPIHSDLRFENMIFENNDIKYIIDFSDLRLSYLEDDLGRFFQYLVYVKDIRLEQIIELIGTYQEYSGITLNMKNLKVSLLYHLLYRFYYDTKSIEDINARNNLTTKTSQIISNLHFF